ncbi:MAG: precorrin-6A synthase (deacetylating) [Marmoricola sp.]
MRRLRVIGIGPGHPDQVTVEAVAALNDVDAFIVADKDRGVDDLVAAREEICRRHIRGDHRIIEVPDPPRDRSPASYGRAVGDWHESRAAAYEAVIREQIGEDETGGFLVWGDPALYDSTIRVVERILARGELGFEYDVVPGVSSVQLLAARHRLVLNRVGEPITVTTGRRLADAADDGTDDLVVMLDGRLACADLAGDWDIWWGTNLGTRDESLVAGRLSEVIGEIRHRREEAKRGSGWVMDCYLLRRAGPWPARTLVIGGARSGKSREAERMLAEEPAVTYVATGYPASADQEWAERVARHRQRRPEHWQTCETLDLVSLLAAEGPPLLVDCLTLWLTRVMDRHHAWDDGAWAAGASAAVTAEIDGVVAAWHATRRRVVSVTNEVGQGLVPASAASGRFRDLMGGLNAAIAAESDDVRWCVAGRVLRLGAGGRARA